MYYLIRHKCNLTKMAFIVHVFNQQNDNKTSAWIIWNNVKADIVFQNVRENVFT